LPELNETTHQSVRLHIRAGPGGLEIDLPLDHAFIFGSIYSSMPTPASGSKAQSKA
jgi:hypothetical protein